MPASQSRSRSLPRRRRSPRGKKQATTEAVDSTATVYRTPGEEARETAPAIHQEELVSYPLDCLGRHCEPPPLTYEAMRQ